MKLFLEIIRPMCTWSKYSQNIWKKQNEGPSHLFMMRMPFFRLFAHFSCFLKDAFW